MDKLARELGITVEQLRNFIAGNSSQAVTQYCSLEAVTHLLISVVAIAFALFLILRGLKIARTRKFNDVGFVGWVMVIAGITVGLLVGVDSLIDSIGWLYYPQGKMIKLLINTIGG